MQSNLDWNDPLSWLTALALLVLLGLQGWLIIRNSSLSAGRKWLRATLNGLLWLLLVGYFLQIRWSAEPPNKHALLVGADVPATVVRSVRDSLGVDDSFTARNLKTDYDSVTLIGQNFPTETLTQLSNSVVAWIPYNPPDRAQELHWKGIVRQGELQRVTGRIQSSRKQLLAIRYGNQTLDSVALRSGANAFSLVFPAFAKGRTQTELVLGNTVIDTLRFFARPVYPLAVQFLLNNPDFESKTLANWLGKQGYTVQLSTTLSKNVNNSVGINTSAPSGSGGKLPDLIITEPANAGSPIVRKAVADGRSVLFINLTTPETDCRVINQAVGSRLQVRKIGNEPTVPIGPGLTALSYRFADGLNQFGVVGYPVVVQRTAGRVGASLLSETFPLSLSGDSLRYNRIWYAILAQLQPADKNSILVEAPVFSDLPGRITVNNPTVRATRIRVGNDTVSLAYSPVNERSAVGTLLTRQTGWQPVQDSLAVYIAPHQSTNPVANRRVVNQFVRVHAQYQTAGESTDRQTEVKLPNWAWLVLFVLCFTVLWIEPKLN